MKNMKKKIIVMTVLALLLALFAACQEIPVESEPPETEKVHKPLTQELIQILDGDPELKAMLENSIAKAKRVNPDRKSNPAQSLEEYYDFLDWAAEPMPWSILKNMEYATVFDSIDQGLDYFYFILDQPLQELEGKLETGEYYYNSLQYHEKLRPWIVKYCRDWGNYLSSSASWNEEYYQNILADKHFNMDEGWYESASNWKSFNDFFARRLSSPDVRPIAEPENSAVLVSPADSEPQGVWEIDGNSQIIQHEDSEVVIKSSILESVEYLIGTDSAYCDAFAGGTLTHTFLNVDDYHRYHFPIGGTVKEVRLIEAQDAIGGITVWDEDLGKYILISDTPGWQTIETRGCVILETQEYGLVAILPVGMSQVSSVNFTVEEGDEVQKGDELGYFLFGGSDIIMVFQEGISVEMEAAKNRDGTYHHVLMGEHYATLSRDVSQTEFEQQFEIATTGAGTKVIFDTDMGYMNDDAYALFELLRADELGYIDLLGITTAGGNCLVASATYDTLAMLEYLGRTDVPVYMGNDEPINGFLDIEEVQKTIGKFSYIGAYAYTGDDTYTTDYSLSKERGLSRSTLPEPKETPEKDSAADFIVEQVHKYPGKVTILAVGGLTNIAEALEQDPTVAASAAGIIYMGGVFDVPGEALPSMEINFWYDPEATQKCLQAGWKSQIIVPHDAAVTCLKGKDVYERFELKNTNLITGLVVDMLRPIYKSGGEEELLYCWDPIAAAVMLCPELVIRQEVRDVAVDTREGMTYGSSFAWPEGCGPEGTAACQVVFQVDRDRFWDFFSTLCAINAD